MIAPALLQGRDRYERVMDGWVDNTHEDAFTHTVQLRDDDRGRAFGRHAAVADLSHPRGALPVGGALDPAGRGRGLAGTQMVGGLSRRVAELTGAGEGAGFVLGALVEARDSLARWPSFPASGPSAHPAGTPGSAGSSTRPAGSISRTRASRIATRGAASSARAR